MSSPRATAPASGIDSHPVSRLFPPGVVARGIPLLVTRPVSCRAFPTLVQVTDPDRMAGRVELKVEFTPRSTSTFLPREGVERLNDRTWVFRGKDIIDAWLKYSSF